MKEIFLLILIIIILAIIYFCNRTLENFDDDIPPSVVPVRNKKDLFRVTEIFPGAGNEFYGVNIYPNAALEGEVIGCGSRREPCYGGSQEIIANLLPPLNISNENIAPRNGRLGPYPPFEQVGYLYKIMAPYEDNSYRPLYLKRLNPNVRFPKYEYFTKTNDGIIHKVITQSPLRQLGTNDQVKIEGFDYFFRVTINQSNFPTAVEIN